jgi:hypothetical protein
MAVLTQELTSLLVVQIVAEAENRAPRDAGLGEKSVARLEALSVSQPLDHGSGRSGSVAPAPATEKQQQVRVWGLVLILG